MHVEELAKVKLGLWDFRASGLDCFGLFVDFVGLLAGPGLLTTPRYPRFRSGRRFPSGVGSAMHLRGSQTTRRRFVSVSVCYLKSFLVFSWSSHLFFTLPFWILLVFKDSVYSLFMFLQRFFGFTEASLIQFANIPLFFFLARSGYTCTAYTAIRFSFSRFLGCFSSCNRSPSN